MPEFRQNKSAEQAEDSSPNPSFSICDIPIQKESVEVLPNPFPKNSFDKTESAFRPATLPEYLEGRTPKKKTPFPFSKKFHPRQIRNARSVFLSGLPRLCEAVAGDSFFIGIGFKKVRILYNEYRQFSLFVKS